MSTKTNENELEKIISIKRKIIYKSSDSGELAISMKQKMPVKHKFVKIIEKHDNVIVKRKKYIKREISKVSRKTGHCYCGAEQRRIILADRTWRVICSHTGEVISGCIHTGE